MGYKVSFILLRLLLIVCVLYDSGYSLQCYSCLNPIGVCTNVANCTPNFDACLSLKGETTTYYQCWKFDSCNYKDLSKAFGEKSLKYDCCQRDLCNRSDGMRLTGNTALLVPQLLAVFWRLFT